MTFSIIFISEPPKRNSIRITQQVNSFKTDLECYIQIPYFNLHIFLIFIFDLGAPPNIYTLVVYMGVPPYEKLDYHLGGPVSHSPKFFFGGPLYKSLCLDIFLNNNIF